MQKRALTQTPIHKRAQRVFGAPAMRRMCDGNHPVSGSCNLTTLITECVPLLCMCAPSLSDYSMYVSSVTDSSFVSLAAPPSHPLSLSLSLSFSPLYLFTLHPPSSLFPFFIISPSQCATKTVDNSRLTL